MKRTQDSLLLLVAVVVAVAVQSSTVDAAEPPGPPTPPLGPSSTPAPGWALTTNLIPTNLHPASTGTVEIDLFNIGAKASHGEVTVTDTLPSGITALEAGEIRGLRDGVTPNLGHALWDCSGNGPSEAVAGASVVVCTNTPLLSEISGGGGSPFTPLNLEEVESEEKIPMPPVGIRVATGAESPSEPNRVSIAGGGAPGAAAVSSPIVVSATPPPFGFSSANAWFSNADGTLDTLAGSHPYEATFTFNLSSESAGSESLEAVGGEPRHLRLQLPPGLIADPTAVPQCTRAQLTSERCPKASVIGLDSTYFGTGIGISQPLYNMVPPPGHAVQLAFSFQGILVFLNASVRTDGDYSAFVESQVPQKVLQKNVATIWGVPGETSHNLWRSGTLGGCSRENIEGNGVNLLEEGVEQYCVAGPASILKPFLTLPTSCGRLAPVLLRADNWQAPTLTEAQFNLYDSNGVASTFAGCEQLGFQPSISARSTAGQADTPSGLSFDVKADLMGLQQRGGRAASNVRKVTVALPDGFTVNPSRASGLQSCEESAAESALGTEGPANCPAASRIGTARIITPLLEAAEEKVLEGQVYLLRSEPPEIHLLVAASGDGVNLKLVGVAHLNELTGQLTTTFGESPQLEAEDPYLAGHLRVPDLPFTSFELSLDGGPQAAVTNPSRCGIYQSATDFTPWAGPSIPDVKTGAPLTVAAGVVNAACPSASALPFSPSLLAGTTNPVAGSSSSFALRVSRSDDQQNVKAVDITLPPGQLAKLAGVPICPDLAATSGGCPAGSQVGTTSALIGSGSSPLLVPQPGKAPTAVYLAGPYKGAPYSLVIKVPAQAGPFDLGTVAVRSGLYVNETTAQVTAKSDPLPQILKGVPVQYSSIMVSIDRPGFISNPTNCEPMKVTGTIAGSEGASANVSNPYQIGDCASLAFKPKLALHLKGGTRRHTFPALKATLTYPKQGAYANIKKAQVTLPHSEFLEQGHIGTVCTRVQFAAKACPQASIYGKAMAISPLLDKPVSGPVYLRSSNNPLPDMVAELNGQIDVALDGKVDTGKGGGIRNTFQAVPDAPVSKFVLELKGGKKGLLVNSENICSEPQHAIADFTGQNGKVYDTNPLISNDCGKKGKKGSKGKKKTFKRVGTSHR